jgi:hypothetical protein
MVSVLFEYIELIIKNRRYLERNDVCEIFKRLPGVYCR